MGAIVELPGIGHYPQIEAPSPRAGALSRIHRGCAGVSAMICLRCPWEGEGAALSRIATLAKAYWGYEAAQMDAWRNDLAIDPQSTPHRWTRVAEWDGETVGVVQLAFADASADILHLWVHPQFMHRGIGRALMDAALAETHGRGFRRVIIDADPNAEPFYLAMGARRAGQVAAPIEGEPGRVRPQMVIDLGG